MHIRICTFYLIIIKIYVVKYTADFNVNDKNVSYIKNKITFVLIL